MSYEPHACPKCGQPVTYAGTGRPPRWCSDGCRRAADYEVRRLARRLDRIEDELPRWLRAVDRGQHPNGGSLAHARDRLAALTEDHAAAEARLRLLLDDPEPNRAD